MKKINIEENGIYMQFLVDENKHLSLYNFSTRKIDAPDDFKWTRVWSLPFAYCQRATPFLPSETAENFV